MCGRPRGCLTSAALGGHVHTRALCVIHGGEVLGDSRVDPNCAIKIILGCSKSHSYAVTLGDLASIGTQHMETQHTLLYDVCVCVCECVCVYECVCVICMVCVWSTIQGYHVAE